MCSDKRDRRDKVSNPVEYRLDITRNLRTGDIVSVNEIAPLLRVVEKREMAVNGVRSYVITFETVGDGCDETQYEVVAAVEKTHEPFLHKKDSKFKKPITYISLKRQTIISTHTASELGIEIDCVSGNTDRTQNTNYSVPRGARVVGECPHCQSYLAEVEELDAGENLIVCTECPAWALKSQYESFDENRKWSSITEGEQITLQDCLSDDGE